MTSRPSSAASNATYSSIGVGSATSSRRRIGAPVTGCGTSSVLPNRICTGSGERRGTARVASLRPATGVVSASAISAAMRPACSCANARDSSTKRSVAATRSSNGA